MGVLLAIPWVGSTAATPYGWQPGAPDLLPDDYSHSMCFFNVPTGNDQSRWLAAMAYLDDATSMTDLAQSCLTTTDIVAVYQTPIAPFPGSRGVTQCTTWINTFVCGQMRVTVDIWQIGLEATDPTNHDLNIHKTVRHEIGHTTGLSHHIGGADAMISGAVATNWSFLAYTAHDIHHINCLCTD